MAMFSGKKDESLGLDSRLGEQVIGKVGDVHTLLGQGSEFEGKLTFEGQVRIDGKFSGQIVTQDMLVIGETASVKADIKGGTIVIYGAVEGTLVARNCVELHPPARVKGSIETPALVIAKGVIWEGTTKMEQPSKGSSPATALKS